MTLMRRIRAYHATLAVLTVLAYVSGEAGLIHAWLGYAVAAVILVRLIWAMTGVRQLGLMRFYPDFLGLRFDNALTHPAISRTLLLSIATCLIIVTTTGIAMDNGRSIGLADTFVVAPVYADDDQNKEARRGERKDDALEGVHETFANLLLVLVGMHVSYLLLFKRQLARFMLFLDAPPQRRE